MQHSKYFSLDVSSMVQGRSESPNTSFSSSLANSWMYHKFPKTRMVIIVFKNFNYRFVPDNRGEFPCNIRTKLQHRRLYHDPNQQRNVRYKFRLLRKQFSRVQPYLKHKSVDFIADIHVCQICSFFRSDQHQIKKSPSFFYGQTLT